MWDKNTAKAGSRARQRMLEDKVTADAGGDKRAGTRTKDENGEWRARTKDRRHGSLSRTTVRPE